MLKRFFVLPILFLLAPVCGSAAVDELLKVTFLDAGYADAILIEPPGGRKILLDGGDVKKPDLVFEFLKSREIDTLDLVIISHPHKNHFGALFRVLEEVRIREIVWNGGPKQEPPFEDLMDRIREKKIPVRTLKAGDRLSAGSLRFDIFHPGETLEDNINANSLVLKLIYENVSLLFTTDITPGVQDNLIRKFGKELAADLVQIPHHGGPLTQTFIEFFKPQFFALSTGPNEWMLPLERQVAALQGEVFRTDRHGNLIFESDGKKIWRIKAD